MSFEYKNILSLHIKYVDYLISKTILSHQGLSNIGLCGAEVEGEIRTFFQNLVPERFKVTHGYILNANDNISEPKVSPQVDLMLVDTLVTHNFFTLDKNNGVEIVPVEAVVGIIEIKRTLAKNSFLDAIDHLEQIIRTVSITKDNKKHYLPGGIPLGNELTSGIYSNPFVGVVSLDNKEFGEPEKIKSFFEEQTQKVKVDFVASLSGLMMCTTENENSNNFVTRNVIVDRNSTLHYVYFDKNNDTQISILSKLMGFICAYLANCTGIKLDVNKYFFNKSILDSISNASKD